VATIRPGITPAELAELHAAGVRGIRFNFVRRLADPKPDDYYLGLVDMVAELGWHIVVYFEAPDLAERWNLFTSLPTAVVVDHMGRPDVTEPLDGEGFTLFKRFMSEHENAWCKVSGAERLTKSGPPDYSDVVPFARNLVETFPARVLWGTDWPHPNMKSHMPDDGALVDFIPRIAPTAELQQKLLVDNPLRLYWEAA
jgi:2-pyrone-4,6-dicarboxylate lactonase